LTNKIIFLFYIKINYKKNNMINSTNIERNIELNFPIEKVKQDIDRTVANGGYAMHAKNEILNTYRIGKITGLESINMNITLKSLENGNTNIHLVVSEKIRSNGHQIIVDRMIDAFLERLSKALVGANDEELRVVSSANQGCLVTTLLLIALGLTATVSAAVFF